MAHEIAKLLLEHARTFPERGEAIKSAMALGMPLKEIEDYLDWLDFMQQGRTKDADQNPEDPDPPS